MSAWWGIFVIILVLLVHWAFVSFRIEEVERSIDYLRSDAFGEIRHEALTWIRKQRASESKLRGRIRKSEKRIEAIENKVSPSVDGKVPPQ